MYFELFDNLTHNVLGDFDTEEEARAFARDVLAPEDVPFLLLWEFGTDGAIRRELRGRQVTAFVAGPMNFMAAVLDKSPDLVLRTASGDYVVEFKAIKPVGRLANPEAVQPAATASNTMAPSSQRWEAA